jgi:toxin ParE1/3/4
MLPIVWLDSALNDLSRITEYIADRNPKVAYQLNDKLRDDAELLGQPHIQYRMGRVAGTHEFVSHPNYIIVYRRTLIAVEILNIVHSRQQYPKSVDKVQLRK